MNAAVTRNESEEARRRFVERKKTNKLLESVTFGNQNQFCLPHVSAATSFLRPFQKYVRISVAVFASFVISYSRRPFLNKTSFVVSLLLKAVLTTPSVHFWFSVFGIEQNPWKLRWSGIIALIMNNFPEMLSPCTRITFMMLLIMMKRNHVFERGHWYCPNTWNVYSFFIPAEFPSV